MEKLLDIIIPQYKEDEKLVGKLLASIENQVDVDFNEIGVIIVNDGSDVILSKKFLNKFTKLDIKYLKNKENLGQGPTEQKGIDSSKAKYITFIDSDDELIKDRLHFALDTLKKNDFNVLLSYFVEEIKRDKQFRYITHTVDLLHYLHGAFIKREYLKKIDVKFNPNIKYCEDSYFTKIFFMQTPEQPILKTPIYLWKYNSKSLMRSNNVIRKIYDDLFKTCFYAYEYLIKKNNNKENEYLLLSGFFDLFVKLESDQFDKRRINKCEKELYNKYLEYKDIFDKNANILDEMYKNELKTNKMVFPNIQFKLTFNEFLKKMEK